MENGLLLLELHCYQYLPCCSAVPLGHQADGYMCDIQGENKWRELGRDVEILYILSFLLIDGELPAMNRSLMS